jgi:hypothetical protein
MALVCSYDTFIGELSLRSDFVVANQETPRSRYGLQ